MSASKQRGTAFETAVVDFLRTHGFPYAERRAQRGARDCGDIAGIIGWVLELKAHHAMDLGTWMGEAQKEAINDGSFRYAVVHRRWGKNIRDSYVTIPLWAFADLLADEPAAEVAS